MCSVFCCFKRRRPKCLGGVSDAEKEEREHLIGGNTGGTSDSSSPLIQKHHYPREAAGDGQSTSVYDSELSDNDNHRQKLIEDEEILSDLDIVLSDDGGDIGSHYNIGDYSSCAHNIQEKVKYI